MLSLFQKLACKLLQDSSIPLRNKLLRGLSTEVIPNLSIERQFELSRTLISLSTSDATLVCLVLNWRFRSLKCLYSQSITRAILNQLMENSRLVIQLLNTLKPALVEPTLRASKRVKTDAYAHTLFTLRMFTKAYLHSTKEQNTTKDSLEELAICADILGSAPVPGSPELISCLLETLGTLTQYDPRAHSETFYIQQRLMAAIEHAAAKIDVEIL
jgi:hypothetical protein